MCECATAENNLFILESNIQVIRPTVNLSVRAS